MAIVYQSMIILSAVQDVRLTDHHSHRSRAIVSYTSHKLRSSGCM